MNKTSTKHCSYFFWLLLNISRIHIKLWSHSLCKDMQKSRNPKEGKFFFIKTYFGETHGILRQFYYSHFFFLKTELVSDLFQDRNHRKSFLQQKTVWQVDHYLGRQWSTLYCMYSDSWILYTSFLHCTGNWT